MKTYLITWIQLQKKNMGPGTRNYGTVEYKGKNSYEALWKYATDLQKNGAKISEYKIINVKIK